MHTKFSITSNVRNFLAAVNAVEKRGAEEACLMVVDGLPGLGKSRTLKWWAVHNGALRIEAQPRWTVAWMLREMLEKLDPKIKPFRSVERLTKQVFEALAKRHREMAARGSSFGVVIDEAEPVVRDKEMIETLRLALSDRLEIPFILAGMDEIRSDLIRVTPQAASRVSQYLEFHPATLEDTVLLTRDLCEVEVRDDLVAFLHKASAGFVREIKEGLKSIERFGKNNPGPVGIAEMDDHHLLNDRKTGKSILVKSQK
ncbi:MAG: ATP-binding protein [Magnetococcus sp. DMHC-1]